MKVYLGFNHLYIPLPDTFALLTICCISDIISERN